MKNLFMPFHTGAVAVNFFFCLSGYVLMFQLERINGTSKWLLARLVRLYPLLWLGLILGLVSDYLTSRSLSSSFKGIAISFLGIQSLFQEFLLNINQPLWSLSIEIIVTPFVIAMYIFRKRNLRLFSLFVVSIAIIHLGNRHPIMLAIPFFIVGAISSRIEFKLKSELANQLLIALAALYPFLSPIIYHFGNSAVWISLKCLLFFILMQLLISSNASERLKSISLVLGKRTFSLYVVHFPIVSVMRTAIDPHTLVQFSLFVFCSIAAVGFIAEVSYRLVDRFAVNLSRMILLTGK